MAVAGLVTDEMSIEAEALDRHPSGGVARIGTGGPPRGSLGSASCRLFLELYRWSRLRILLGDLSVWLFAGKEMFVAGRRSQKGLIGLLLAMNCSVSTLKNSVPPE
jgi:hypothetical protein